MDELQYQIDLLRAVNRKLNGEKNMYKALLDTSANAYLYYSYEEDSYITLGKWEHFFTSPIRTRADVNRVLADSLKEEYVKPFQDAAYNDEAQESLIVTCCSKDCRLWYECEINIIRDEAGQPREKLIRLRDITKFKRQQEDLAYLACYDSLTGLFNRNYFVQKLMEWIERASRERTVISVAFININRFRKINDSSGVLVGDEILQQFGQFLNGLCMDKQMMCAHFASDAYGLAIYEPYGERSMESVYRRICERLKTPLLLTSGSMSITIRVGVAEYPEASENALELIERAEIVMFKAKHSQGNDIRYFDSGIIQNFLLNAKIEQKLKGAVYDEEFIQYYQPQYDTRTGKMRGVEALLRWRDADGRYISPAQFIPIAEKSSLIIDIGDWVLEKALATQAEWKRKYGISLVMSVNISTVQFAKEGFARKVIRMMKDYKVPPEEIELEITETVLIENFDTIIQKLRLLQQHGIQTAIDDFGIGYSSFSYLRGLPIHTIKIDKSFIDSMLEDEAGSIIVESIISMVNKLGYETIAEGVEEKKQYEYLKRIGCEYIQGYYLGKPMPAAEMEGLLEKRVWE